MKRLPIGYIRSKFEKEDWILLSREYIGAHSKLDYICPEGHRGSITWANWSQGNRCSSCAGIKKHTIEFIKLEFEKSGYECVSNEYINARSKLAYSCSKGHSGVITWSDWKSGYRCPTCFGNKKLTISFVKTGFEKEGWTLISTKYINANQKLYYICPEGHRGLITWSNWNKGNRCLICAIIKRTGYGNPSWKGGISKEPYCQDWTKDLKGFVKERDNYKCINPYCVSKAPNDLTVHHINYNKKSCGPENLITICRSCNSKANKDRDWHEAWYKAILNKRYGYIYDEKEK